MPEKEPADRLPDVENRLPDVEVGASASTREVTFHELPDVWTAFSDDGQHAVRSERENLPERVGPGTTHHGVRARYRAVNRLRPR